MPMWLVGGKPGFEPWSDWLQGGVSANPLGPSPVLGGLSVGDRCCYLATGFRQKAQGQHGFLSQGCARAT